MQEIGPPRRPHTSKPICTLAPGASEPPAPKMPLPP